MTVLTSQLQPGSDSFEANRAAMSITSVKKEGTLVEITFPPQRVLAG